MLHSHEPFKPTFTIYYFTKTVIVEVECTELSLTYLILIQCLLSERLKKGTLATDIISDIIRKRNPKN